jgi:uncharacterized protein YaaR (DUF327 family)
MDKIPENNLPFLNPVSYSALNTGAKKTRRKPAVNESKGSKFSVILDDVKQETEAEAPVLNSSIEPSEEAVQGLLDAVHNAGDALKNRPLPEEIKRYRKAVKDFLHYVVENTYVVEQEAGIPHSFRPGFKKPRNSSEARKHTDYHVIQIVDRKLDQLAAGILAGQTAQLEILTRLEEIKGILVDLLQ